VRVLVADDAVLFRRLLADVLSSIPGVEVVGSASNGKIAIQKVHELKPDLLTLDIEMPEMDGLAVLDALFQSGQPKLDVLVVSALSRRGGDLTVKALERGAFDFITKPDAATPELGRDALLRELAPRIRALAHRQDVRALLRGTIAPVRPVVPVRPQAIQQPSKDLALDGIAARMQRLSNMPRPEMILIGVSTGGPVALAQILPAIPADIGVPIFVVQHMPPIFTKALADNLASKCSVRVREAVHGELPEAGTVYIAPGGRQMRLGVASNNKPVVELTDDPPENNCRPAVDFLFRSVANRFPGRSAAVILTGMGSDGTLGLRLLKRQGCFVIAQDEASCVVYGMPKAAVDAGVADAILPLDAIASRIISIVRGGRA
jgi:two-component system chemotaxis response regulator CheB